MLRLSIDCYWICKTPNKKRCRQSRLVGTTMQNGMSLLAIENVVAVPVPIAGAAVVIVGAIIGIFRSAVISRVPDGQVMVLPTTYCRLGDTPLLPYDNIPI